jgi:ribose transport system permease protein
MTQMKERISSAFTDGIAVWIIVGVLAMLATVYSDSFLTVKNVPNVLGQAVPLIIITVGMFVAIIAGQIDLSVAAVVKLTAVLVSGIADGDGAKFVGAVALAFAIGMCVGLFNSLLVVRLKIPAFIATLGTFSILEGLVLAYTIKGVGSIPTPVVTTLYGNFGPIPYSMLVLLLLLAAVGLWLRRSRMGLHLYAVGGDTEVARRSGVRSGPVITTSLVTCSLFAVLAGLVQVSRAGVGAPTTGDGMELLAITAVVIGGASLMGGRGRLLGAVGGAVLLALIDNALNMVGISQYTQGLFRGAIIVAAITVFVSKKGAKT